MSLVADGAGLQVCGAQGQGRLEQVDHRSPVVVDVGAVGQILADVVAGRLQDVEAVVEPTQRPPVDEGIVPAEPVTGSQRPGLVVTLAVAAPAVAAGATGTGAGLDLHPTPGASWPPIEKT